MQGKFDSRFIALLRDVCSRHQKMESMTSYLQLTFAIEILHKFFMSAKNEKEKRQRRTDFLKGINPRNSIYEIDWLIYIKNFTFHMIVRITFVNLVIPLECNDNCFKFSIISRLMINWGISTNTMDITSNHTWVMPLPLPKQLMLEVRMVFKRTKEPGIQQSLK